MDSKDSIKINAYAMLQAGEDLSKVFDVTKEYLTPYDYTELEIWHNVVFPKRWESPVEEYFAITPKSPSHKASYNYWVSVYIPEAMECKDSGFDYYITGSVGDESIICFDIKADSERSVKEKTDALFEKYRPRFCSIRPYEYQKSDRFS